jgi:hypothetical protein
MYVIADVYNEASAPKKPRDTVNARRSLADAPADSRGERLR